MKAVIYARKSTDEDDRSDDNKSVTRQVERAKAYADARCCVIGTISPFEETSTAVTVELLWVPWQGWGGAQAESYIFTESAKKCVFIGPPPVSVSALRVTLLRLQIWSINLQIANHDISHYRWIHPISLPDGPHEPLAWIPGSSPNSGLHRVITQHTIYVL